MKPEAVTPEVVALAIMEPPDNWKGNCYGVACAMIRALPIAGRAVYGHYNGEVAETSFFKAGHVFQRHGWIVLDDGRILDPTRWVFEDVRPYIYLAEPTDDYDMGGNAWRQLMQPSMPAFDPDDEKIDFYEHLEFEEQEFVGGLLGGPPHVSDKQLFWLANLSHETLAPHARAIYAALEAIGQRVWVPWDNWVWVMEEK